MQDRLPERRYRCFRADAGPARAISCLASVRASGTKVAKVKEVGVTKKKPDPRLSGWVQVVVSLAIITAATAGTGQHNSVPSPRPLTGCVQLRVLA